MNFLLSDDFLSIMMSTDYFKKKENIYDRNYQATLRNTTQSNSYF